MTSVPFEKANNIANIIGVNHGFFGRIGQKDSDFFNCSINFGNDPEFAKINRNIAKNAIAGKDAILASVKQTHSNDVFIVNEDYLTQEPPEADALVSATKGFALSILTADCTPVLFADKKAGIIGAAHAGWQGAVGGILGNTVDKMIGLGAKRENIVAAIGPTISGASYQIGKARAKDIIKANEKAEKFIYIPKNSDRENFDLPAFITADLKNTGILNIEKIAQCTAKNPQQYFSHRYAVNNKTPAGRQISIIALI
jgi:hypothetical protein